MNVYLESLGCAKNMVDSEIILGQFADAGWQIVEDPGRAETIIVNTCSFIESAADESIDATEPDALIAAAPPTTPDPFARDSYRVTPVVCPFRGEIDYEPGDIECGLLEVPENREKPDSRFIELHFVKLNSRWGKDEDDVRDWAMKNNVNLLMLEMKAVRSKYYRKAAPAAQKTADNVIAPKRSASSCRRTM